MGIIDNNAMSKSFSNAAVSYNFWAQPQKKVAKKLVELLPVGNEYKNILDLGCGTGNVIEQLQRYSTAKMLGIDIASGMVEYCKERWNGNSDINFFKDDISLFKPKSKYDLIISSCVFQWIDDFYDVIEKLILSLDNDGCLAIAVPVEGSFFELQESYKSTLGCSMPGLRYKKKKYYIDIAVKCNLNLRVVEVETVYGHFSGLNVLKYFKKIGATFQHNKNYTPLGIKDIHQLINHYGKTYGLYNGLLPVTHKILYLIADVCS